MKNYDISTTEFAEFLISEFQLKIDISDLYDLLQRIVIIEHDFYDYKKEGNKYNELANKIANVRDQLDPNLNEFSNAHLILGESVLELIDHLRKAEEILLSHHSDGTKTNLEMHKICNMCADFWSQKIGISPTRSNDKLALTDFECFVWHVLKAREQKIIPSTDKYRKRHFKGFDTALRESTKKKPL